MAWISGRVQSLRSTLRLAATAAADAAPGASAGSGGSVTAPTG